MESQLNWLKTLATKIHPSLNAKQSFYDLIEYYINDTLNQYPKSIWVDTKRYPYIVSDFPYIIFSDSPYLFCKTMICSILNYDSKNKTGYFKPLILNAKLTRKEYFIDFNNNRLIYVIHSSLTNEYLLNAITFNSISFPKVFYGLESDKIKKCFDELSSLVDMSKKEISKSKNTIDYNIRKECFRKVIESLKFDNKDSTNSIILVSNESDYTDQALDIIYSKLIIKNAFYDTVKEIQKTYYKDYKCYIVNHTNNMPFDFRLKKSTIYFEKDKSKIYLFNLFNNGCYVPLPCYLQQKQLYYNAHPFIKLRYYLMNYYTLTIFDTNNLVNNNFMAYKQFLLSAITKQINSYYKSYDTSELKWVGIFRDEDYDKLKFNQSHRYLGPSSETFLH